MISNPQWKYYHKCIFITQSFLKEIAREKWKRACRVFVFENASPKKFATKVIPSPSFAQNVRSAGSCKKGKIGEISRLGTSGLASFGRSIYLPAIMWEEIFPQKCEEMAKAGKRKVSKTKSLHALRNRTGKIQKQIEVLDIFREGVWLRSS